MKLASTVGLVAVTLGAAPLSILAQGASTQSVAASQPLTLVLRVREESEAPIAGAELTVKGGKTEKTVRTDANGVARFDGFSPGDIEIRVRRVGYKQTEMPARIAAGENDLVIHIDPSTVVLDEMRVVGAPHVVSRLEDFELRLKRREASAVVTQAQIEKRNPVKLSTMLRGMPGLRLADSLGNTVAVSTRGKKLVVRGGGGGLTDCVFRMSLDGVVLPPLSDIDQIVPKDVYGVEIFNGPSRIPPNMGGLRQDSWCGLIAIWTRGG